MESDKYHSEVSQDLIAWFVNKYPGNYLFENSTGYASKEHVKYGVPSFGGGADYFAFRDGAICEFYEVKTNRYPYLSSKQKHFCKMMTDKGFKCFVYREGRSDPVIWDRYKP